MVQDVKQRGLPAYKKIHDMMLDEEVVGGDETTENINGVLKWLWTWRSERLTYLAGGKGRGPKDFDSEYPDGFPKSHLSPTVSHFTIMLLRKDIRFALHIC